MITLNNETWLLVAVAGTSLATIYSLFNAISAIDNYINFVCHIVRHTLVITIVNVEVPLEY